MVERRPVPGDRQSVVTCTNPFCGQDFTVPSFFANVVIGGGGPDSAVMEVTCPHCKIVARPLGRGGGTFSTVGGRLVRLLDELEALPDDATVDDVVQIIEARGPEFRPLLEALLRILRDPVWQGIGGVASIVTLVLTMTLGGDKQASPPAPPPAPIVLEVGQQDQLEDVATELRRLRREVRQERHHTDDRQKHGQPGDATGHDGAAEHDLRGQGDTQP